MAKEYKLSYTAQEINEKLGKIGEPVSWNELADKPFGIEVELVEILPEQSVTGVDESSYTDENTGKKTYSKEFGNHINEDIIKFEIGKSYTVEINGEKTQVECVDDEEDGFVFNLDGVLLNYYMLSDSPITYRVLVEWFAEIGETITLAIYEEQQDIKLIDDNLIPDTIARKTDIEEAIANIDSSVSAPNAAPNQQLVTDEFGNTKWEDKVLYKSNRTVINFNTDECSDHGEDATDGRFEFEVPFTQLGHDIPNIWSNAEWPLTFQLDDESFTIAGRRLPIILSNPTDKIKRAQIYQYGADILISMTFDEPGDHIFVFEAGRDKYTQLDYGYMPEGYPKIVSTRANSTNAASVTGTTVDGGESYYATFSSFTPVAGTTYQVFIGSVGYDFDVFVATATTDENGNVIVGDLMAPHVEPPFCMIHQTGDTYPTLYWNGKYGAQIYFGKSEIQEEIIPMDEKFLPDTVMRKGDISWEDLTDRPFYSKMGFVPVMNETTIEIADVNEPGIIYVQLAEDTHYVVTINGAEYRCTSVVSPYSPDYIELGNTDLAGDIDDDMPFMVAHTAGSSVSFISMPAVGTYTVSIRHEAEVTKPIDEKFIPDSVALKSDIEEAIAGLEVGGGSAGPISWNDLTDKPFDIQEGASITQVQMGMSARVRNGIYYLYPTTYATIEENQTYVFYFNGINYFITFQQGYSSYLETEALIAGSMGEILTDNEFPFQIVKNPEQNYCAVLWPESLGRNLWLGMYRDESVQKLDTRLMPEGTLTSSEWFIPVFTDQNIEFVAEGDYFVADLPPLSSNWEIRAGSASVVRLNDSWGASTAWYSSVVNAVCIGDSSLIGENTHPSSIKCLIIINKDGTMRMISDTEGTALVGLQAEVWMYDTINEKFLPEDLARKSDIEAALANVPSAEILTTEEIDELMSQLI